ncbi:hypothetical protein quinque_016386 [Culex quinquefasciatus]
MPPAIPPMVPPHSGWRWIRTLGRIHAGTLPLRGDIQQERHRPGRARASGSKSRKYSCSRARSENLLAQIWGLCDTNQCGKLRLEEFCLAMWFVDRAKKGIPPPEVLAPNMVPPGMRKGSLIAAAEPKPTYNNPELEMISKEIEEAVQGAAPDGDRSLQSEKDTLTATLKQLENQKGEAQKRLDDLKNQV